MSGIPAPPVGLVKETGVLDQITAWVSENKMAAAAIAAAIGGGIVLYSLKSSSTPAPDPAPEPTKPEVANDDKVEPTPVSLPPVVVPTGDPIAQAQELKEKGNTAFKAKKWDVAIDFYTKAIDVYPAEDATCAIFYNNRGACLSHIKPVQHEKIIGDCSKAIKMNPTYVKAYTKRAAQYENIKDNRSALVDYIAAVQISGGVEKSSGTSPLNMAVDRILQTMGQAAAKAIMDDRVPLIPAVSTLRPFFDGFGTDIYGKEEAGIAELDRLVAESPKDGSLRYRRAVAHLVAATYSEVYDDAAAAVKLLPASSASKAALVDALSLKGTFQHLRGELPLAEQTFQEALALDPNHTLTLIRRAIATLEMPTPDKLKKSQDDLHQAATLEPKNPAVLYHQAQLLMLSQQFASASDGFKKCIDFGHGGYTPWLQLAATKHRLGQSNEAMKLFVKVEKLFPNEAMVYIYKGQILMNQGKTDEADAAFAKANSADSANPLPFVNKGMLYMQGDPPGTPPSVDKIKEGLDMFEKAIAIEPKCDVAHNHLGQTAMQQKNYAKAITHFNEVIRLVHTADELAMACSFKEAAAAQLVLQQKAL
jgi:import receptor subunit TOM70